LKAVRKIMFDNFPRGKQFTSAIYDELLNDTYYDFMIFYYYVINFFFIDRSSNY